MNFGNSSNRLEKARERAGTEHQVDHAEAYRIRGKMIGVLLRDARLDAGRSLDDCARVLQVAPEDIEAWEYGDQVPSLPQLEILAYYLGVPVSHFWSTTTREAEREEYSSAAQREYLAIRDRMIGALIRQARLEEDMTLEALGEATGISAGQLERYELGEDTLPLHELSVIASALKKSMRYFLESNSHFGEYLSLREEWKRFVELPEDVRAFAANPLHVGFIEIAMMLSQMPADRLRRIGESILNITM